MTKTPEQIKRNREIIGGGAAILAIIEAGITLVAFAYRDPESMLAAIGIGLFGAGLTALELHLTKGNGETSEAPDSTITSSHEDRPMKGPEVNPYKGIGKGGSSRRDNRGRDDY